MSIIVNLMTNKEGEIKRFLDYYYNNETHTDNDVMEWIYIYNNPKEAINTIKAFINSVRTFEISLWVQIDDEDLINVKRNNQKDVINKIENIILEQYV